MRARLFLRGLFALSLALAAAPAPAAESSRELVRQARAHEAASEELLAIRRYTEAISLDPSYGEAYLGLGALRMRRGDVREAERVYSVALSHLPTLKTALVGRAEARWAMGDRDEAERDLEEYARTEEAPAAMRELAGWYGEEGRTAAQLATWRRLHVVALHQGDGALEREARTMIRALQLLVDDADPVTHPATDDPVRRGLARVARRAD